jgi:hypothetical protein
MKATQHMAGGVGASLALQSITSPTAAGSGAGAATPANSSGQAAAPTSGGGASAQLTIGHYIFGMQPFIFFMPL